MRSTATGSFRRAAPATVMICVWPMMGFVFSRPFTPKRSIQKSLTTTIRLSNLRSRPQSDGCKYYLLPPHHYGLGVTVETFKMPRNVTGVALGKSTYARAGLLVNTTPLEAGWTGRLVVEIANLANLPLRVYVNEGIGQILFFESDEDCAVSYEDRGGKVSGANRSDLCKALTHICLLGTLPFRARR